MTTLEQVAELLEPFAASSGLQCSRHPETEAIMSCTGCGCGLCRNCLQTQAGKGKVICSACASRAVKKRTLIFGIKLLKLPAAWVLLCVFISGLAYSCNFRNPTLQERTATEAHRPWFQKSVGKLLLDKASRENQRAAALRYLKRTDDAIIWDKRAAITFAKTANYWQETPVYNDLKIGEARSVMQSGDTERALTMLKAIKVKSNEISYPSYNYYLGQAYESTGKPTVAQQYFKKAMVTAEIIEQHGLENYTKLMTGDRRAAKVIGSVELICGTTLTVDYLAKKLEKYGIKPKPKQLDINLGRFSKLLGKYKGKVKLKKHQPTSDEEQVPAGEIEIEFNQPATQKKKTNDDFTVEFNH